MQDAQRPLLGEGPCQIWCRMKGRFNGVLFKTKCNLKLLLFHIKEVSFHEMEAETAFVPHQMFASKRSCCTHNRH